ncbi:MAG: MATE family efflux transporter [Acetobacter sp.]|nr:MATE family efflux transporter [Bacteroides sp.]MCM1340350.1 MATE family efflux transporter [Acetobacter sp.]MCM1433003.1 MATE family efflux transporter [Clostridiales bacterium]
MKDNTRVFEDYKVPKAVATMALPSMMGMLINIVYNLADTFFVGQTGDSNQVAAVSVSMPLFLLFIAVGNLFGVGGCAFISRSLGEGKKDRVKTISSFCIYGSIAVGIILGILFFTLKNPLLYLVGASDNTIGYAQDYLQWVAIGAPFVVTSITVGNLVRGEGAAKTSMIGSVLGQAINIILDPIFILGKGDKLFGITLPFGLDMGVAGAAIATVLGNIFSVVFFLIYFLRGKSILSITPKRFSAKNGIAKGVVNVGLPAALNNLLMSISNIIINIVLVGYGDNAVAAMGVAMKANMLVVMLQIGLAQGVQPLIGYCYGAKNYTRMKSCMRFSILCNIIIGTAMMLFYLIFRETVISMFIDNKEVIDIGVKMLTALMSPGPVIGIMFVLNFAFQGMGKGIQSFILSVGRQGLIYIPLLFIMNRFIGLDGVVWCQAAADFACVIMSLLMWLKTKKDLKKQLTQQA